MARNRGRRASDHKTHDVIMWSEGVWVDGLEETQWVVYDSRVDKVYRFNEKHAALQALEELAKQDPQINKL